MALLLKVYLEGYCRTHSCTLHGRKRHNEAAHRMSISHTACAMCFRGKHLLKQNSANWGSPDLVSGGQNMK